MTGVGFLHSSLLTSQKLADNGRTLEYKENKLNCIESFMHVVA